MNVGLNSHGFPALPNELYSEILSHLQAIPIPQSAYLKDAIDPQRHVTLSSLSQTCKSLRSFFLQYAWECIEVFEGMWTPTGRLATEDELRLPDADMKEPLHAKFAEEVRRQLETVTVRNPDLVRFVNVLVVTSSHKTVMLPQLAKILSLLPHVHTLQISTALFDFTQTNSWQYEYPQIQTLCLRDSGYIYDDLLLACPNLTTFTQYDPGILLLHPLLRSCSRHLQTLGILSTICELPYQELASRFPHLRDIAMDDLTLRINENNLIPLSLLPLHTLRLCLTVVQDPVPFSYASPADCERWIGLAKTILRKCPTHGSEVVQKRVVVIKNGRSVECYPV